MNMMMTFSVSGEDEGFYYDLITKRSGELRINSNGQQRHHHESKEKQNRLNHILKIAKIFY